MHFLSHMLRVCYFSILIRLMNGYLLFAANLDDFRAIAEKLIPETLAESLTQMAARPFLREKLDDSDQENTEEVSSEIDSDSLPPIKGKKEKHPPIKDVKETQKPKETFVLNRGTKVDFDELVERVKKRITMELKETYLDNIRKEEFSKKKQNNKKIFNADKYSKYNKKDADSTVLNMKNVKKQVKKEEKAKIVKDRFDFEEMSPFVDTPDYDEDIFNKPKVKQEIKTIKTTIEPDDYEDAVVSPSKFSNLIQKGHKNVNSASENLINKKVVQAVQEIGSTTNSDGLYKKLDLTQNDSYEDYVTPAKENIYASSENQQRYDKDENKQHKKLKRYKIETNRQTFHKNFNNDRATVKSKDGSNIHEREIKISQKNYDYKERNVESEEIKAKIENWYDNHEKAIDIGTLSRTTKKPKHGTKSPTRRTYKMATPNFIASFPVVVEKYDFDEPIPDKDRERESLKYIGNPPARINKKIPLL